MEMFFHRFGPVGLIATAAGASQRFAFDEAQLRMIDQCQENPRLFMEPGDEMFVDKIRMESPGGFSLKGLGEPFKQLRELIKDLWFRNKQEKRAGELALLRERLQLVAQYGLPEPQLQRLVEGSLEDTNELGKLVGAKKLLLLSEGTIEAPMKPAPQVAKAEPVDVDAETPESPPESTIVKRKPGRKRKS